MDIGWIITVSVCILGFLIIHRDVKTNARKTKPSRKEPEVSNEGFVYVISNPYFSSGIFKIGLTTKDVNTRKSQLFTTGVPGPFDTCIILEAEDCSLLEKELHRKFKLNRINPRREFFKLSKDEVTKILEEYQDLVVFRDDTNISRNFLGI